MARGIPVQLSDALDSRNAKLVVLVKIEYVSGTSLAWSGIGDIEFEGETYKGVGRLGGVGTARESTDFESNNITLSLSGVDSSMIALIANESGQGAPVTVKYGLFESGVIYAFTSFKGFVDYSAVTDDPDNGSTEIIVVCTRDISDLNKSNALSYTPEVQKAFFEDDEGFDFTPSITDKDIVWGNNS